MKALILAAGRGERLQPITDTRPKPLIPILCKPLIEWIIRTIENTRLVDEVIIVVSYLKEKIINHINSLNVDLKIKFVDQGSELGTGDAVIKGLSNIKDIDEDVLIIYSDIFLSDWSVLRDIAVIDDNVIVGYYSPNPSNYGVLLIENGLLKSIVEKPEKPLSNLINTGIYKLRIRDILENKDVETSSRGEKEFTDVINNIIKHSRIRVLDISNRTKWIDIGLPWNIIDANKIALESLCENSIKSIVEENVTIKPPVYIGEGSIIRSGSYIEGPVYIDRGVEIGPNARIRPYSVICSGSRIGFSVEVKESIIMENVHISHLSYVGDSIVCENTNFGAGTITANLRFDEKTVSVNIKGRRVDSGRRKLGAIIGGYVKTGIHVSIMPGVKIGSYSWISPGAVVKHDIPSKSFVKTEVNYFIDTLHNEIFDE